MWIDTDGYCGRYMKQDLISHFRYVRYNTVLRFCYARLPSSVVLTSVWVAFSI